MRTLAERRTAGLPKIKPRKQGDSISEASLATVFVEQLANLGVESAFGVSGGAIALFFDALTNSPIRLHHCRHESGAAFAASEAYFVRRKPTVVFTTTGPGILNCLTGMMAARWDGAKVILVSGMTNAPQRGRWAFQETSSYTLPQDALYSQGPLFDFAVRMEHQAEFAGVLRHLHQGLTQPGRFVAHICLPMGLQAHRMARTEQQPLLASSPPTAARQDIHTCAELLQQGPFAIWAGFGATKSAPLVRRLAERCSAPVLCSPRGKGVMPENHPLYLGVSGLGGHDSINHFMQQQRPRWILVLGTRLGEATSFWDRDLQPSEGFIHVDIDPKVPGVAYPDSNTLAIHSEIGLFLEELLDDLPADLVHNEKSLPARKNHTAPFVEPVPIPVAEKGPVRPQVLLHAIQRRVVAGSDAVVMAECGNAFAWCNHHLRFLQAERYRVSTLFGSMGHATSGVVGIALARQGKAVTVVGDGSMLMNSEIHTAVQYGAAAVWIVLNDGGYGMCRDGHRALGLTDSNIDFPQVDFALWAQSMGADGATVNREGQLEEALDQAMTTQSPFVLDVRIDTSVASPLLRRFESLIKQGNAKNVAGWEAESDSK